MLDCIILAGGLGTRLRSVITDAPKPMALIDGIPFLQWQLDYLVYQGFSRVILSVGYKSEYIKDYFGNSYCGLELKYSEENVPLGTGGGIFCALDYVDKDHVVILNGDTFFPLNFNKLSEILLDKNHSTMVMAAFISDKADQYGAIELTNDSRLVKLKSESARIGELSNAGTYLCQKSSLNEIKKYFDETQKISFESEVIPKLLIQGHVIYVAKFDSPFIDIGTPEDFKRASKVLQNWKKEPDI